MKRLGVAFDDAVDKGTFVTANEIRSYAIKSIAETSSGKQVQRSKQGGGTYTHTAAAKGQAPNTDTGKLVASIAAERVALRLIRPVSYRQVDVRPGHHSDGKRIRSLLGRVDDG